MRAGESARRVLLPPATQVQGRNWCGTSLSEVVQSMEIPTRSGLGGETLIIVGSRSETATFPYGFFKDWTLDTNTARFRRH